ncbi:Lipin-3-like protein [Leptotrombidium deliense]|uniref:Lipin-3-like protein n=1 Tax=Leptotrombidium deliense TaxID=299467 RepID=A0A443SHV4_9ACAR|nr:Lipin-3-like protein [Leptotrombidium deliense]
MNYIGRFFENCRGFYNEINSATLTGAIDVVVVEQEDGSFLASPFHVRFGKLGVLRSREKIVDIEINGEPVDIHMKLGDTGEAFFVEEVEDEEESVPSYLATSPLPDEIIVQMDSSQNNLYRDFVATHKRFDGSNGAEKLDQDKNCDADSGVNMPIKKEKASVGIQTSISCECNCSRRPSVSIGVQTNLEEDFVDNAKAVDVLNCETPKQPCKKYSVIKYNSDEDLHQPPNHTTVDIDDEIFQMDNDLDSNNGNVTEKITPSLTRSSSVPNIVEAEEQINLGFQSDDESHLINVLEKSSGAKSSKRKITKYRKTLTLISEQIASLNLQEGANETVFSVTTAFQGTTKCKCTLYLWRFDDKIVVSDIDGTITKSDVLGHILPILGKDWAQSGVANLFTKIRSNGYRLLYLSARAIGQAKTTREYLRSVRQGTVCLPDGPLLLSPTSLISAFHREVIEKKPEEFKITCLKEIQSLFPSNPFYSGFGNKVNDTWAYRAVGIPSSRIFTINHRGELTLELIQYFQSTYTKLSDVVDQMFPPVPQDLEKTEDFRSEYSQFNYWREPMESVSVTDPLLAVNEDKSTASSQSTKVTAQ